MGFTGHIHVHSDKNVRVNREGEGKKKERGREKKGGGEKGMDFTHREGGREGKDKRKRTNFTHR